MIYLFYLLLPLAFYCVWKLWHIDSEEARYRKAREADRRLIAAYWKERAKVIKPRVKSYWDGEII